MTFRHKLIYVFQFLLYSLIIGSVLLLKPSSGQMTLLFSAVFISEMCLVFVQSKMNDSEIYYKKSGLMGLCDLIAATAYMGYFMTFLVAWILDYKFQFLILPLVLLFAYTLLRKIYIFKNYTYEK